VKGVWVELFHAGAQTGAPLRTMLIEVKAALNGRRRRAAALNWLF
jgi:hypothetical protein